MTTLPGFIIFPIVDWFCDYSFLLEIVEDGQIENNNSVSVTGLIWLFYLVGLSHVFRRRPTRMQKHAAVNAQESAADFGIHASALLSAYSRAHARLGGKFKNPNFARRIKVCSIFSQSAAASACIVVNLDAVIV